MFPYQYYYVHIYTIIHSDALFDTLHETIYYVIFNSRLVTRSVQIVEARNVSSSVQNMMHVTKHLYYVSFAIQSATSAIIHIPDL